MSYVEITSTEIETGKPVSATTQDKIKDNFIDHESRIQLLEGGADVAYPPIILAVNGPYAVINTTDDILRTTMNFNLTITAVYLIITTAGSSGDTIIDIEYKRGGGSWTSIFTTKPSVPSSGGANAISSNAVLDADESDLQAGDLLRLNLDGVQGGTPDGFIVRIDYIKS